jgi:hypothetical protein
VIAAFCLMIGCGVGVGMAGSESARPVGAPASIESTVTVTATATVRPVETAPARPSVRASPRPAQKAAPRKPKPRPSKTVKAAPRTDPRYPTCAAAKRAGYGPYRSGIDAEYRWYQDRDGDGVVCE